MENKRSTVKLFILFFALALAVVMALECVAYLLPKKEDDNGGNGPGMSAAIAGIESNVFCITDGDKVGTGFIVTSDGEGNAVAVTCYHTAGSDASRLSVKMHGSDRYDSAIATVIGWDSEYDITVLKISGDFDYTDLIATGKLKGDLPEVGREVALLGNSEGKGISAFDGIVGSYAQAVKCVAPDSTNLHLRYLPAIQISAAVNAGSSGCPVFDKDGAVIGMGFYQVFGTTERPVYGMSYAIPASIVKKAVENALCSGGRADRLSADLSAETVADGEDYSVFTTVRVDEIGFTFRLDGNTVTATGGEHNGKTVAKVGGVEVSELSGLLTSLMRYSLNGKYGQLEIEFTDGSTAVTEARATVFE